MRLSGPPGLPFSRKECNLEFQEAGAGIPEQAQARRAQARAACLRQRGGIISLILVSEFTKRK